MNASYLYSLLLIVACLVHASSCKSFRENAKYELNDGYYKVRIEGSGDKKFYVHAREDTLVAFPQRGKGRQKQPDTTSAHRLPFPVSLKGKIPPAHIFHEYSFDLDVLAIPFKYRPAREGVPRQLSSQFNGALYGGFRTDRYRVSYEPTPLGVADRTITHYGYSIGYFTGIGAEPINPWVTRDQYGGEYDGVVWTNGLAGIIGINKLTFGLGLGLDYLLDRNRHIWIYQAKPWVGLTLGLNIN